MCWNKECRYTGTQHSCPSKERTLQYVYYIHWRLDNNIVLHEYKGKLCALHKCLQLVPQLQPPIFKPIIYSPPERQYVKWLSTVKYQYNVNTNIRSMSQRKAARFPPSCKGPSDDMALSYHMAANALILHSSLWSHPVICGRTLSFSALIHWQENLPMSVGGLLQTQHSHSKAGIRHINALRTQKYTYSTVWISWFDSVNYYWSTTSPRTSSKAAFDLSIQSWLVWQAVHIYTSLIHHSYMCSWIIQNTQTIHWIPV